MMYESAPWAGQVILQQSLECMIIRASHHVEAFTGPAVESTGYVICPNQLSNFLKKAAESTATEESMPNLHAQNVLHSQRVSAPTKLTVRA